MANKPAISNEPDVLTQNGAEVNPSSNAWDAYDVIICGTDFIQSILSSALSRAGKKVLHCDGNDWYGGFDAVLYAGSSLDSFIDGFENLTGATAIQGGIQVAEGRKKVKKDNDSLQLLPREKYGNLRLHSQTFSRVMTQSDVAVEVTDENPSNAKIETLSIEDEEKEAEEGTVDDYKDADNHPSPENASIVNKTNSTQKPAVVPLEHGFCFDINPSLLYASGDAVECMVKSGVADYLEFKSLKGLYLFIEEEKSSMLRVRRRRQPPQSQSKDANNRNGDKDGESGNSSNRNLALFRVPCSKGDVFRSKLLSPMDKRRLMKFLQLITDYGTATQLGDDQPPNDATDLSNAEGDATNDSNKAKGQIPHSVSGDDAIQSINERYLHRGRALSRPQNKATPTSSEMDALMRCIHDGVSFSDSLTKVSKLLERLSTVVVYALALDPFG